MSIFGSYQESIKILEGVLGEVEAWSDGAVQSGLYRESKAQIDIINYAITQLKLQLEKEEKVFSGTQAFHNFVNGEDTKEI